MVRPEPKSEITYSVLWSHRKGDKVTRDHKLFDEYVDASDYGRSIVDGFQQARDKNYFVVVRKRARYNDTVKTETVWSIMGEKGDGKAD